jgi:hypothetical protein
MKKELPMISNPYQHGETLGEDIRAYIEAWERYILQGANVAVRIQDHNIQKGEPTHVEFQGEREDPGINY